MLSIAACRKQLGAAGVDLSDAEVERLRDSMATLAAAALRRVQRLSDAEREEIQERAAIMEFDGGLARSAAERAAMLRVIEGARRTDA